MGAASPNSASTWAGVAVVVGAVVLINSNFKQHETTKATVPGYWGVKIQDSKKLDEAPVPLDDEPVHQYPAPPPVLVEE